MKIPKTFMLLSVLVVCFSTSLSWGNYNDFPMDDPEVTGTFMEYRTGHFHGGIDLISRQSNNIVRPVAEGDLFYTYDDSNETYKIWIDHDTGKYANLATRYLHIGEYPGATLHKPGVSRPVTTSDTLGTIVTPHDGYGDHLHFEVRDGSTRSTADYLNPLSKLPEIADSSANYATDATAPWTWTIIDSEGDFIDVNVSNGMALGIPSLDFRLLFKGFDRINNSPPPASERYLGFYSITARLLKNSEVQGAPFTETLLEWTFTADRLPRALWESPHYLFNDQESVWSGDVYISTESQFYYRLFAHDDSNNLSINLYDHDGSGIVDWEGYIDRDAFYGSTSDYYFEVVVADYEGNPSTQQLLFPATAIGDRFEDFRASSGTRQVTLSWSSDRGAGYWSHFKIQRSQDSGVSYTTLDSVAYDPTSASGEYEYVDNTATDDVAYYYRVFTDELYGPVWARPFSGYATPAPGTPVISIGDTGAGYFGLSIDTGATYADGYQVEYGSVGQSFPWSATIKGTPTETVYDDSLTAGTYEVRVQGYNNTGQGSYSNTATFTLETPATPATPTGTVHTSRPGSDRGWVLMKWTANPEPDIVGYKVYCFDGTDYQPVADVRGTAWSSLGADIWPTDAEIADGRYALHADGSGVDLENDPHLVYTNSPSSTYNDSISYWFAIKAKNRLGNLSELSAPWRAMLPGASGRLAADERWAGSVRVAGDVTVPAGVTLRVAANSVLQFLADRDDTGGGTDAGRSELIVAGTLDASAGSITFRSTNASPTAAEWYGIRVGSGGRANLSSASLHDGVRCVSNEGGTVTLTNDLGERTTTFDACGMEPSAPENLEATRGSESVSLTWEAPADNGGVALSGYQYRTDDSTWTGDATSPLSLEGLTNGTEYTFWVRAVNAAGIAGDSAKVVATPQAPIMGRATVRFAENGTDTVAVYTSPQVGVGWSLTGPDADSLRIDGSGQLRFGSPPDYEAPADADTNNVYAVSVVASDGTRADTLDVMVTVDNVEEAGRLVLSPLPPQVGPNLTATLTDPDGPLPDYR